MLTSGDLLSLTVCYNGVCTYLCTGGCQWVCTYVYVRMCAKEVKLPVSCTIHLTPEVCLCLCVCGSCISNLVCAKLNMWSCTFDPSFLSQLLLSCNDPAWSLVMSLRRWFTSVMWSKLSVVSLLRWWPKPLMFWQDMDLRKIPDSLQVDSPCPHPFACVLLYSGAYLWFRRGS